MGQSLSNATVASSYPCLFKVGDNAALSSTLKRMSDGLGNDAPLWMTTKMISNFGPTGNITNTAFGYDALMSDLASGGNTAIGRDALNSTTGANNTAIGVYAMILNTTGSNNTAVGIESLKSNITGAVNTAIGASAMGYHTSGDGNTAIGAGALESDTVGSNNIGIGRNNSAGNFDNCLVIGLGATATGNNQVVIGNSIYPLGSIATESLTPTESWLVKINGVDYKIPLQIA